MHISEAEMTKRKHRRSKRAQAIMDGLLQVLDYEKGRGDELKLESVDFDYKGRTWTVRYISLLFDSPEQAVARAKFEIDRKEGKE